MKYLAPSALMLSITVALADYVHNYTIDMPIWLVNVAVWGYITYLLIKRPE